MEITNSFLVFLTLSLLIQVYNAEESSTKATRAPYNPLEHLILNQNQNGLSNKHLSRVRRQYGPYYGRPVPVPVPIIVGAGGFGVGYGLGAYGRGYGRGYGGRGYGGRGFGGRGGGFGGRGGGFGGGRGGRG